MQDRVLNAALAGLLHDIGKFSQRAGLVKQEQWDRAVQAQVKYEHALASYSFVQQFVPASWRSDLGGVAYHHQPRSKEERWIQLADWMSSAEREEDEDTKTFLLQSVFTRVNEYTTPEYWPLTRLEYGNASGLFPVGNASPEWKSDYQQQYAKLWDAFEGACRARSIEPTTGLTREGFLENLLSALQESAWCVPSTSWKSVADVSLYDHLRTTSALAACLAADDRDEAWCESVWSDLKGKRPSQSAALLVGGDFSAIQEFIYTLASSGAAKSLRARSFYLQLLGDVIAQSVLDALELPATNLLYVGGGGFQLLAPLRSAEALPAIEQGLIEKVLNAHRGSLGLTIAWQEIRADEFGRFSEVYTRLGQSLAQKKRRPFAAAPATLLAQQIGAPLNLGGDPLRFCKVTGDDWDVQTRNDETKTGFIWSLEELGRQLPHASHLVMARAQDQLSQRPRTWQEGLRLFGYDVSLLSESDGPREISSPGLVRVWRLDPRSRSSTETRALVTGARGDVVLSEHPMAKLAPLDEHGDLLTFDELAKDKAHGIKRWGVLRLDVDNLGRIFHDGLGAHATLSRIASLSFGLRVFFEGILPELADSAAKDRLYIQYAGGDDLFVVGAWDALPAYALQIREQFRRFTGGNPAFTLSAGIAIVDASYPLYQAARDAQDAEDAAKDFVQPEGHHKDAVTFLGRTTDWAALGRMQADAQQMERWVRGRIIPASVLQTLQSLAQQIRLEQERARKARAPKPRFGRWMWMAAYQITRALDGVRGRGEEAEQAKQKIRDMQAVFLAPGTDGERVGATARWAQFLARGGSEHE